MKNLFLFSAFLVFACSCGNNNSNNKGVDYFFEIEFGGETHEIRGNTTDVYPIGSLNACYAANLQTLQFTIGDKSADNYISGENLSISMSVDNMSIGNNSGSLNLVVAGVTFTDYLASIGIDYPHNVYFSETSGATSFGGEMAISDITITDLGNAPSTWNQADCDAPVGGTCFKETVKGSYESVLYFTDGSSFPYVYSIPVPIKIRFSAPRLN